MPCVQLAFRRRKKGFLGRAINFITGLKGFDHIELVFSDGKWFTSTSLEGGRDGARFSNADLVEGEYVFVPIECSAEQEARMRHEAEWLVQVGARYDFDGCKTYVIPFAKHDPDAWYCSEVVQHLLRLGGIHKGDKPPHACSPNYLAKVYGATKLI